MPPYAYIAAWNDNALTIIDVANPAAPAFVGSIQGAGAAPWLGGASAVFVVGHYAYVACDVDNALTIVDISNPAAPVFVGSIQGFGAPNWLGQATDVFVVGNYAYVAARRVSAGPTQDSALTIIDISNPSLPAFVGSILLHGGSFPNWMNEACGVFVRGSFAYVVSDGDGFPFDGANALTIIDVSNPAIPTLSGLIQGLGIPNWLGGARGISLQGNYAYIAAYYNNGGALPALTVIDISNPALPAFVGSIQGGWGAPPWLAGAYGIHVRGNYAYIAANTDSALTIIDISNPAAPVFSGSIQDPGGPLWPLLGAIDVSIQGNYAYVAAPWGGPATDGAFTVVDISNPLAPIIVGSIQGGGAPPWLGGATGAFLLAGVMAPTVTTDPATMVTQLTARLNDTLIDDGGEVCACGFEWGTTVAYGNTTPVQNMVTGQTFSQDILALLGGTIYHFRAFATNSAGTGYGADRTFVTASAGSFVCPYDGAVFSSWGELYIHLLSVHGLYICTICGALFSTWEALYSHLATHGVFSAQVMTLAATSITENAARLNGVVIEDLGVVSETRFQYGLTTEYGMNTPWQHGFAKGDSFFVNLTGLGEGAAFHFRAQLRNQGGVVSGNDMTFNTLSTLGPVTLIDDELVLLLEAV